MRTSSTHPSIPDLPARHRGEHRGLPCPYGCRRSGQDDRGAQCREAWVTHLRWADSAHGLTRADRNPDQDSSRPRRGRQGEKVARRAAGLAEGAAELVGQRNRFRPDRDRGVAAGACQRAGTQPVRPDRLAFLLVGDRDPRTERGGTGLERTKRGGTKCRGAERRVSRKRATGSANRGHRQSVGADYPGPRSRRRSGGRPLATEPTLDPA
jgi:hypothetical protein